MPITEKQAALRRKHIGASDSPAILGVSPFTTPSEIWEAKVHGTSKWDGKESSAMSMGNLLEDAAITLLERVEGLKVRRNQFRVSKSDPLFSASHDGLVVGRNEGVEAKTVVNPGFWEGQEDPLMRWGETGTDEIPLTYRIQVQHQMYVSGLKAVWLPVVMLSSRRAANPPIYRVERDDEMIEAIVSTCREWWERHVVGGEPPADANGLYSMRVHSLAERLAGKQVPLPEEADALMDWWASLRIVSKRLEEEQDRTKAQLVAMLGDAEEGVAPSGRRVSYKARKHTGLDRKALEAEAPDLVRKHTRTTESRVAALAGPGSRPKPQDLPPWQDVLAKLERGADAPEQLDHEGDANDG